MEDELADWEAEVDDVSFLFQKFWCSPGCPSPEADSFRKAIGSLPVA